MLRQFKKETNDEVSKFRNLYKINNGDLEIGIPENDNDRKIFIINALDEIIELSNAVLGDMRSILKRYNKWLVFLQIVSVVSSASLIPIILIDQDYFIDIIIGGLTLISSTGGVIAKSLIAPFFGRGRDKQLISNELIGLRGDSIALKLRLNIDNENIVN